MDRINVRFCFRRVEEDWATFTCGPLATVVRRTIAIATVTRPVCGPSVLIAPSTMGKTLITTRAVRAPWLPRSAMVPRIPILEW